MVVGGGMRKGLQDADKYFPEGFHFLLHFIGKKCYIVFGKLKM